MLNVTEAQTLFCLPVYIQSNIFCCSEFAPVTYQNGFKCLNIYSFIYLLLYRKIFFLIARITLLVFIFFHFFTTFFVYQLHNWPDLEIWILPPWTALSGGSFFPLIKSPHLFITVSRNSGVSAPPGGTRASQEKLLISYPAMNYENQSPQ